MVPNARVLGERRAGPPPRSLLELQRPDVLRPACPPFGFLIAAANCAFQDFVLGRQDEKGERERGKQSGERRNEVRQIPDFLAHPGRGPRGKAASRRRSARGLPAAGTGRCSRGGLSEGGERGARRSGALGAPGPRRTGGAAGLRRNGSRRNAGERGPRAQRGPARSRASR